MSSGETPIGAAKGKQTMTMASCQPPPPPACESSLHPNLLGPPPPDGCLPDQPFGNRQTPPPTQNRFSNNQQPLLATTFQPNDPAPAPSSPALRSGAWKEVPGP